MKQGFFEIIENTPLTDSVFRMYFEALAKKYRFDLNLPFEQLSQEAKDAMAKMIPLQELGEPEDVAKAIRFLASDDAAYITGQTLAVSGGMAF